MNKALSLTPSSAPNLAAPRRLRSARYRAADFKLGSLAASFECKTTRFTCTVVDFSFDGLALAIEGADAPLVLVGDRLSNLRVYRDDALFFEGLATVRHVAERDTELLLGLSLDGASLDLPKLYALEAELDLERRLALAFAAIDGFSEIPAAFKGWVADVGLALDALSEHLRSEQRRIDPLDHLAREHAASQLVDAAAKRFDAYMTRAVAELNHLVAKLDTRGHALHRSYLQRQLLDRFIGESPFFRRCYKKPLGYAGDYEIMNMVYRDHRLGATLYGQVLSVFGLSLTAARAVANRVAYVTERVAEIVRNQPIYRVTSLACGPAREIAELLQRRTLDATTLTLLDVEPLAIQYCEKTLLPIVRRSENPAKLRFIRESVRQIVRGHGLQSLLEAQDLILSMGLFDYFSDKLFRQLLLRLYDLLRPGGHLIIGNFDHTNDSRYVMEYLMEWYLEHRSAAELRALAECLPENAAVHVEAEPLGVNLFLHITKPA